MSLLNYGASFDAAERRVLHTPPPWPQGGLPQQTNSKTELACRKSAHGMIMTARRLLPFFRFDKPFSNATLVRVFCCSCDLLQLSATRHLNTDSDTELMSELFGMELAARRPAIGPPVTRELLFEVVQVPTHTTGVTRNCLIRLQVFIFQMGFVLPAQPTPGRCSG